MGGLCFTAKQHKVWNTLREKAQYKQWMREDFSEHHIYWPAISGFYPSNGTKAGTVSVVLNRKHTGYNLIICYHYTTAKGHFTGL